MLVRCGNVDIVVVLGRGSGVGGIGGDWFDF